MRVGLAFTMSNDPIGQAIGWVGTTMAIFLFLAPLPTMRKVSRARSTLEFSATPFLVSTLNCGLWSVYALPVITPDRYQSLVCNVFCLVMEVAYICHFLRFAANRRALWLRLAGAVATLAALVGIAIALDAAAVPVAGIVGERKELLNAVADADAINYCTRRRHNAAGCLT